MATTNDAHLTRLDFRKAGTVERKFDRLMTDADLETRRKKKTKIRLELSN